MPKSIRAALTLAALLPLSSYSVEGEWGYAHILFVKKSLTENLSAITGTQVTWRDDFSEFYFTYADAGIGYKFNSNWSAGLVYRQGWWHLNDEWEVERRPLINLTWSEQWKGIRLANRARLEFRYYDWDKEDDHRFRNRTRIEFPWELPPGGIKPFVEEEVFFGFNSEKIEMNWLMAGLYFKPTKQIKLKAGYRLFGIRIGDEWENRNQLITGMIVVF